MRTNDVWQCWLAAMALAVLGACGGGGGGGASGDSSSGSSSSGISSSTSGSSSGSTSSSSTSSGTTSSSGTGSSGGSGTGARVVFLHHSTGGVIWDGGVADALAAYNTAHTTDYQISERAFPSGSPYPWENYPYDYWNIWVNHAGNQAYLDEPTLEMLAADYDVIVWKHCFPVSDIEPDTGLPDITSSTKTLENYKLQYQALKAKMRAFPNTRFIVWTGAALLQTETDEARATRAQAFANWVKTTWDEPGDNIYVWDFRQLETEGGLYLLPKNAAGDSHPGASFAAMVAPWFAQRVVDVIEGRGDSGSITGH